MSMPKRRRKRKKLGTKYKRRRAVLMLLMLGLIVGAALWFWSKSQGTDQEIQHLPQGSDTFEQQEIQPIADIQPLAEVQPFATDNQPLDGDSEDWNLVMVSHMYPLPQDYQPPELVTIINVHKVDTRIADDLRRMFTDAKINGVNLMLHDAYRSIDQQRDLFNDIIDTEMAKGRSSDEAIEIATDEVAVPGACEHHTGLAVDILATDYGQLDNSFDTTPSFKWLVENAHNYGFILRYPDGKQQITGVKYKPWHFRYVGREHADVMHQYGYTLEEYLFVVMREYANQPTQDDEDSDAEQQE